MGCSGRGPHVIWSVYQWTGQVMGILSALKKRPSILNLSLTDPKAWNPSLWNLIGSQSLSGENVTEHTALTYSAVWDAVNLISNTVAFLPLHLMQSKGKTRRIADDRYTYRVLHDQANEYMTAMMFRKVLMSHVLTWGNGYAEIVRDGVGEVRALWPITPNRVSVLSDGGIPVYQISMPDGSIVNLPREKTLHITGPSFDGFMGYSVIAMARKSIGLSMALETFGATYFGQGTHPGVIVSHPTKLNAESHSNLKKSLTETYSGLGQSHRLMLLEDGMKIEKVNIPPNDSQFLESRQFGVTDIARWFNLPPHKLKDLTRSSFNNIESEDASFYKGSILPWLILLQQNYDMQLLSKYDRQLSGRGRYYFKHNMKGVLKGDTAAQTAHYSAMLDRGVYSINDVRALEDMDPIEGGDIHLVPLNMQSLEFAGEKQEPNKELGGGKENG
jgi:HK97 family phage portal protein